MVLLLWQCKRGQDCVDSAQIDLGTHQELQFFLVFPSDLSPFSSGLCWFMKHTRKAMDASLLGLCCPMLIASILTRFLWVSFSLVQISARNLVVVWESKFIHLMHHNLNTSYTPLCGIIPDTSKWKENLGQTQELLKGWLSEAGTTWDFLGRAGGQGLDAWTMVLNLLPPCPESG